MKEGYFGKFGGTYASETLMKPLIELKEAYALHVKNHKFQDELNYYLENFIGRPTPLMFAKRLSEHLKGGKIYFKREDLAHTGAHKINNAMGQALLAKYMGKKKIIAETGAGQHGVATASVCALLGLECTIYMGSIDMKRQALNVTRMKLLGAEVKAVDLGTCTLKDAVSEAMRAWVTNVDSYYLLGSVLGPHPYPTMVRDFQTVIGKEAREQILQKENKLPDELVACIGGGSNAIGLFYPFLNDKNINMTGVEAGGIGIDGDKHAARIHGGSVGVFQGTKSYVLQDDYGQILNTHSISAGLDYPAIGPEHAYLHEKGRVNYTFATDEKALEAVYLTASLEGVIPALESAHALAFAIQKAPTLKKDEIMIVNISGRGDKDVKTFANALGKGEA